MMSDLYHYNYSSSHRVMVNVLKKKKNGVKKKIVTSYYCCCSTSDEMNLIDMMMKIQSIETENDALKMNVMKICDYYYCGYDHDYSYSNPYYY